MSDVSEEEMKAVIEQLKGQIDPRKLMTPTQREIAELTKEELEAEYLLVQSKKSERSRSQRDFIVIRYEMLKSFEKELENQKDSK
jgi:hypothetical protein